MSTKLTGYVWDGCAASGMKLSSVAIMARLADFSNDEGVCWPSIETIARQIGAGMSTVRTAIARLEAEGWLTRRARRQGMLPTPSSCIRIISSGLFSGSVIAQAGAIWASGRKKPVPFPARLKRHGKSLPRMTAAALTLSENARLP